MKVRDDGASFLPLLFGFEVDNAIWDGEVFAEAPSVSGAEVVLVVSWVVVVVA